MKKISLTLFGLTVCVMLLLMIVKSPDVGADAVMAARVEQPSQPKQQSSQSQPQLQNQPQQEEPAVQTPSAAQKSVDPFEKAVELIKKYETLHQPRHWPLVGYGHKVLPGEKYSRSKAMPEAQADALLRKDLRKNCAVFREFGADSLLLGTLAYNIGSGATLRSSVTRALKNGNRNIRDLYLAHCRYRGKAHSQIRQRRIEEFDALFNIAGTASPAGEEGKIDSVSYNKSHLPSVSYLCIISR